MIASMSRQTRVMLLGLGVVALLVMLFDASAPWRRGTSVSPAVTPSPEPSRADVQRGLDKTPLVYPAQFVDALVTRLRDALVIAVPSSGGEPVAGVTVASNDIVVATGLAHDRWTVSTAAGRKFDARLTSVDTVRGLALLHTDEAPPAEAVAMNFGPPALASGSPVLALLASPTAVITQLLAAPGTEASLGARLRTGDLAAGTAVIDLDGRLVAFLGAGVRGGLPFTSEDLQNELLPALRTGASLAVPWLGADLQDVSPALASRFEGGSMVVTHVEAESPAAQAGLRAGDVVTSARVGDVAVTTERAFDERVSAGSRVHFEITRQLRQRRSRTETVEVVVGRRRHPIGVDGVAGVSVAETGVPLDVAPASAAARAGLRTGDRVEAIEGQPATASLVEAAFRAPQPRLLTVRRDGRRRYVLTPAHETRS